MKINANKEIIRLIRYARKKRELDHFGQNIEHIIFFDENELHITKGREIFTHNIINTDCTKKYIKSSVTLNIDGKPFRFFWLTRLD